MNGCQLLSYVCIEFFNNGQQLVFYVKNSSFRLSYDFLTLYLNFTMDIVQCLTKPRQKCHTLVEQTMITTPNDRQFFGAIFVCLKKTVINAFECRPFTTIHNHCLIESNCFSFRSKKTIRQSDHIFLKSYNTWKHYVSSCF